MAPMTAAGLNIILFLGTVRQPRNADRVLKFIKPALEARNISVTVFDPLELHLDQVVKPIQYYEQSETPPQSLLNLQSQIKKADGFVVITAEYHGSIAPGLLNLMNQFPPNNYVFRPSAIVSYSKAIPKVEEILTLDGETTDSALTASAEVTINQLIWFAEAIKKQKEAHGLRCTDCFDDTNLGSKGLPYKNKKWSR